MCLQLGPASHEMTLRHIHLQKEHLSGWKKKIRQSFEDLGVLTVHDSASRRRLVHPLPVLLPRCVWSDGLTVITPCLQSGGVTAPWKRLLKVRP